MEGAWKKKKKKKEDREGTILTQHSKWVPSFCAKLWVIENKIKNKTSFNLSEWKNRDEDISYGNWFLVMRFELWVKMMLNPNRPAFGIAKNVLFYYL